MEGGVGACKRLHLHNVSVKVQQKKKEGGREGEKKKERVEKLGWIS